MLKLEIREDAELATRATAETLLELLGRPATRNVLLAGGNSPLGLYARIAERGLGRDDLELFVLDEYVGVPPEDMRTTTNLLRRTVQQAWGLPPLRFHGLSARPAHAEAAVVAHERAIEAAGGIDVAILGLGKNGHLGFNEPGSAPDTGARLVPLEATSIAANREWFAGEHAPDQGATLGLRTLLAARHVLLLAFGPAKAAAVDAMVRGPRHAACPASFLQVHRGAVAFLDRAAAAQLTDARA